LRTIASTTGSTFTSFSDDVVINSSGVVGFRATLSTARRASGIFTSNGIATSTIVDSTNALLGVSAFGIGPPSINASGTVAFEALRSNLRSGLIFTGNGGALTPVLDTLSSNFGSFGAVAINDSGAIVFNGTLKDRNQGVFRLTPNTDENGKAQAPTSFTLIDIVDTNNPDFFQFGDPVINNAGTVADDAGGPARVEIFTGNGSGITDRTDPSSGSFAEFEHPSINNRGAVAFSVIEASGAQGIFVELTGGSSPVAVLQSGDALFGSTVTAVSVGRFGFNDHFRLAFEYELADGRSGIAVALLHSDDADGDDPEQSDSAK
ncbi:MAG TPA: choice-of-anchor tandem repeat NxxGxxAF-containing protein, partial [Candidatus Angelobacter sp.]|nr:choice-of-anchor tandem repeat NxxGxxAF-containing protein [Candidatus Angelobacter sp.]